MKKTTPADNFNLPVYPNMGIATKIGVVSLALLCLGGCARWTTYNKPLDLTKHSVAIDAKQRVVYVNHSDKGFPIVCAEPSPDALAVLGASGALSITEKTGSGGSASSSLAEAASSIGLRTQSIQLLRDLNYRICEAYNNRAIGRSQAAALLRRGQSTMMGLIAIEQLTGPVVAAQATLGASANAGTGSSGTDIATAQTALDQKTNELLTAQTALDTASSTHKQNEAEEKKASSNLAAAKQATKPDPTVISSLKASSDSALATVLVSKNDVADKQRRMLSAQKSVNSAQIRLAKAENGASSAGGSSSSALVAIATANQKITDTLAEKVSDIVVQVNHSYLLDSCISILTEEKDDSGRTTTEFISASLKIACANVIQGYAESGGKFFLK